MMHSKSLSVVIPSYLEEENLRIILPRLRDTLRELTQEYEVLVVDTMTTMDNTKEVCGQNEVRYIQREGGNMYGDAVRTGISKAEGEYIIFMDADGSHTPEFIQELFTERGKCDVVVASRYIAGGNTDNGKVLIFMSWLVNTIYALVLGIRCKDVSNSFKLYRASDVKNITLRCSNFDIVEELLYKIKLAKGKISIKEIPYTFKKRMFGNTKRNLVAFMISYIITLLRLRFGK